ncbi:MAG: xylulokinase, partial [Alphaproteobacteria bacterium]
LLEGGVALDHVSVIGGGARSALWGRILAAALNRPLSYHLGGEVGPAFGAARLGRLAVTGETPADVCVMPAVDHVVEPDEVLRDQLSRRLERWRALYPRLKPLFDPG